MLSKNKKNFCGNSLSSPLRNSKLWGINSVKNKKGLSEIMGYVLLMLFVIIISIIVYQWLNSYVPEDAIKCPEEVSVLIKNMNCSEIAVGETKKEIYLNLKNTGNFNVDGYFIKATETEEQKIGTQDLTRFFNLTASESSGVSNSATKFGGALKFYKSLEPNQEKTAIFDIPNSEEINPYSIEIIPFRFQKYKNKNKFVTCGDSKVLQKLEGC